MFDLLYQGDLSALMTLGAFYKKGTGVEKDFEKSFNCYKAAADQGTQYWLIVLHVISRRNSDVVCIVWFIQAKVPSVCLSVCLCRSLSVSQSVSPSVSGSIDQ